MKAFVYNDSLLNVQCKMILEESLKKLEVDRGVLTESVSEHERTLADVQVSFYHALSFEFSSLSVSCCTVLCE